MLDSFDDTLKSVQVGNEPQNTPQPDAIGNDSQPTTTPTVDDLPENVKSYVKENPAFQTPEMQEWVDRLNRQFQSAFTPKLQEAAELRKRYEGIDEQTVGAIRYLQQLMTTDPRNAAEYLRQQAQLLEGTQNPQAPAATPEPQYEPATEVEALLLKQMGEFQTWRQQMEAQAQQVQLQQRFAQAEAEFGKLETEYGQQIPRESRAAAWEVSQATGGKMNVTDAYFALNRTTLLPGLIQKAKDEASSVVYQKQQQSVPGSLASRGGPAPQTGPKSFDDIWRELNG